MDNVLYNQELQLSRFGAYLLKQQMVREGHERYYVFWVRKFLSRRIEVPSTSQVCPRRPRSRFRLRFRPRLCSVKPLCYRVSHFGNIREVQKYLGHQSVETTIYTHVIRGMDSTAEGPLDEL